MPDGNQVRSAGLARRTPSSRPRSTLSKSRYMSPYTRFQRGGIYRFRSAEPLFRPFRIT
jgi:hypothetical protein